MMVVAGSQPQPDVQLFLAVGVKDSSIGEDRYRHGRLHSQTQTASSGAPAVSFAATKKQGAIRGIEYKVVGQRRT